MQETRSQPIASISPIGAGFTIRLRPPSANTLPMGRCFRGAPNTNQPVERINNRGAPIKVLDKPRFDLTTPLGRGTIAFLSALAEDERIRIKARCAPA